MKRAIAVYVKKSIAKMARKSASIEANSVCSFFGFQPKESPEIKKLRKF